MIATNCQAITITGDYHHFEIRAGQFKPGRKSQRPTVGNMHGMGINISRGPPGTTNTRYQGQVVH